MTGDLRVNVAELRAGSVGFRDAADALPDPPSAFPSLGGDRFSQAMTSRTNETEAPLLDSMPTTRSDAQSTATNIGVAADRYEQTDRQSQAAVNDRLAEFDSKFGAPSSGGGPTDAMGQFGQLMQMPMQMAQQLGQVPMQMAQQLGQIPQTVMQGIQQIGQMGGGLGQGDPDKQGAGAGLAGQEPEAQPEESTDDKQRDEGDEREEQREGAAGPDGGAQRAPAAEPPAQASPSAPPVAAAPSPPQRPPADPSVSL
ncbi:hypothetical protein [Mycolicibacterium houstonense]|uniref:hypothetical protein n=1 Tax=Mycolicibacterium houstonense TaxID=146021 RepID=UPI00135B9EEE|nr:hypothetical protein [Mycolicibacterium houstonense]